MTELATTTDDTIPEDSDRTADLQRFIDREEVIPPGVHQFAGQLVIRDGKGLVGTGRNRTRLQYAGPPRSGGAIKIAASTWGYEVKGFALENLGEYGKGAGIRVGGDTDHPGHGTESNGAVFERVIIDGFRRGAHIGDWPSGRAASELTLIAVETRHCDVGILAEDWNTLNLSVIQFMSMSCRIGLECTQAGSVHVTGGGATDIRESAFKFSQGGVYSVRGVRIETSGRLATIGDTSATVSVAIESCQTSGMVRPDGIDIYTAKGASVAIRDCILEGYVWYDPPGDQPPGYGTVTMDNVRTRWPYLLDGGKRGQCEYAVRNCALLDNGYQVERRVTESGMLNNGPVPK